MIPACTTEALYGATIPGNGGAPTRLWDTYPGAAVVEVALPLPRRDDCPRCLALLAEGGALAAILADDGYCLAPYTHAVMVAEGEAAPGVPWPAPGSTAL